MDHGISSRTGKVKHLWPLTSIERIVTVNTVDDDVSEFG